MTRFPGLTAAEHRLKMCNEWSEKQLQDKIVQLAEELGWMTFHIYDSRRSNPGWPDLVLVHPVRRRLIIWELKSKNGRATPAQLTWLTALRNLGLNVGIKKPEDWASESIQRELAARADSTIEGKPSA
ncbi:VRR-NUC domain-containing protein [Arthrobacter agilis]|uniref:VRR-NUC domain-containing protein n=1 Tax=Arthrobacter agilis TaxID=37921 RepID=UPI00236626AD|nr:VRR-NUC domain-containing protein [Arthrobacter agilis]WDF32233.1 VRR-NUC domain-containing protein [Arthrobacter agilis]